MLLYKRSFSWNNLPPTNVSIKVDNLLKGISRIINVPGIATAIKYEKSANNADKVIKNIRIIFLNPEKILKDLKSFFIATNKKYITVIKK